MCYVGRTFTTYTRVWLKAEVIAGLRSWLSNQFQPWRWTARSARSSRYVECDSPRVSARPGPAAAALSRRLIVSAVMLNLAWAQIASLVVMSSVRRTYETTDYKMHWPDATIRDRIGKKSTMTSERPIPITIYSYFALRIKIRFAREKLYSRRKRAVRF